MSVILLVTLDRYTTGSKMSKRCELVSPCKSYRDFPYKLPKLVPIDVQGCYILITFANTLKSILFSSVLPLSPFSNRIFALFILKSLSRVHKENRPREVKYTEISHIKRSESCYGTSFAKHTLNSFSFFITTSHIAHLSQHLVQDFCQLITMLYHYFLF